MREPGASEVLMCVFHRQPAFDRLLGQQAGASSTPGLERCWCTGEWRRQDVAVGDRHVVHILLAIRPHQRAVLDHLLDIARAPSRSVLGLAFQRAPSARQFEALTAVAPPAG